MVYDEWETYHMLQIKDFCAFKYTNEHINNNYYNNGKGAGIENLGLIKKIYNNPKL